MLPRCLPCLLLMLASLLPGLVLAGSASLTVSAAFVELRSGPGRGYPVIHTLRRGDTLQISARKTAWLQVTAASGAIRGWLHRQQLVALSQDNLPVTIDGTGVDAYARRRWEIGLLQGQADSRYSDGSPLLAVYGSYFFTPGLSAEWQLMQILGEYSESLSTQLNLSHQLAPDWPLAPFFSLGYGRMQISPKTTLGDNQRETHDALNWSLGLRYHLQQRFFLRADVSQYLLLVPRDNIDKVRTWKLGAGIFF